MAILVDSRAFLAGLSRATDDMRDKDGAAFLQDLGRQVIGVARSRAAHRTGYLRGTFGLQVGKDADGPFVDVGTSYPVGTFMEFGTYKDRPQPAMGPALASIGGGGIEGRLAGTARSRGLKRRARMRATIRRFRARGQITSAEARLASRAVSQKYRTRPRRRRRK